MKKQLLFLSFLFNTFIVAQIIEISDANFKAKLLEANKTNFIAKDSSGSSLIIDANENGEIEVSEVGNVWELNIPSASIKLLEGISNFINLRVLICNNNQIKTLNTQGLTKLTTLSCNNNQLTSLNVQDLTNLQDLSFENNLLTSINLQGLINLQSLYCFRNQLTSLNVQDLTKLQVLSCVDNQLTSLNVQGLINLQGLYAGRNQLSSINVQGLTNLEYLSCTGNQLTSLNVQGLTNLEELWCNGNLLTSLNVQGLAKLVRLDCEFNQLTSLNVLGCTNLRGLRCDNNQLTSLNLKTGGTLNLGNLFFNANPNIESICCYERDVIGIKQLVTTNGQTAEVHSDCEELSNEEIIYSTDATLRFSNPTSDRIIFSEEVKSFQLFDTTGKLIQNSIINGKEANVSTLPSGIYFIKISTKNGILTHKLIKS